MSRGFRVAPHGPSIPNVEAKLMTATQGPAPDPGATRGAATERAEIHRATNPDGQENRFPHAVKHGMYSCPPI